MLATWVRPNMAATKRGVQRSSLRCTFGLAPTPKKNMYKLKYSKGNIKQTVARDTTVYNDDFILSGMMNKNLDNIQV